MIVDQLRQRLQALQKTPGIEGRPGTLPFGIPAIDTMLGGGLVRSHEPRHAHDAPGPERLELGVIEHADE